MADAYYVLSDPKRRSEYDNLYKTRADRTTDPGSSSGFFSGMFGGGSANQSRPSQPNAEGVFADAFEEVSHRILCMYAIGQLSTLFVIATATRG